MLSTTLEEVNGHKVGSHPLVRQLLGGCYNSNPPRPRYDATWDPKTVLSFLSGLGDNNSITLAELTGKTVILIALTSLLRVSEIASISFPSISFSQSGVRFSLSRPRKSQHSGPLQKLFIPEFVDSSRCPVKALESYIDRSWVWRQPSSDSSLFLALVAPHSAVTANTISRWVKTLLGRAGIQTSVFSAHFKGAAASAAAKKGAEIESILKAGNWPRELTFNQFYNRVADASVSSLVFGANP